MASRAGVALFGMLLAAGAAAAELPGVSNEARARTDYMLNCQGCHGALGHGLADVPRMQGFVGHFLKVPGGREFLVQVPGSANAAISDARLAELLNWMLPTISAGEMPADFEPYSEAEVTRLRATPAEDVVERRARLLRSIGEKARVK
ncbi:MAG: hypothetical protein AAF515_01775 [Pseudomonadota bacterium]